MQAKKLIEVALPVKEISAESKRDKSIRHGHISTLHLWWARRPLPVSRGMVFASLVPDPEDPNCSIAFRNAVKTLLGPDNTGTDHYKPYKDIPHTAVTDPMEDNLRNRLLMFIGKFSDLYVKNEKEGKKTAAKDLLSPKSLVRWESRLDKEVINIARKLIWVSHNPEINNLENFDTFWEDIVAAEQALYGLTDRHKMRPEVEEKEANLKVAISAFQNRMPKVFDPFAGGGAIPLEMARLGCRTYGNDINPVAHIIQKGSLEYPQRYGKPISFSKEAFVERYGETALEAIPQEQLIHSKGDITGLSIPNRLAFDVEFYAKKLLKLAEQEIGHYYPADENGNKAIAYYWARTARCANPSCKTEIPLLKGFYLVDKPNKKIHLHPIIKGKKIYFEIRKGKIELEGWNKRGNITCPVCGNITGIKEVKRQFIKKEVEPRLLAMITETKEGKRYSLPPASGALKLGSKVDKIRPAEGMQRNSAGGDTFSWGVSSWGQLFTNRQLLAIQTFVEKLAEVKQEFNKFETSYAQALTTYLAIWIDRIAIINTAFGRWNTRGEKLEHPFSRQAIPMVFDFPESNPFCSSSGSALNQLAWIKRYLIAESQHPFVVECQNSSSGEVSQFEKKSLNAVITDPPYYDAIAYADLSDFFYVWLKRTLGDVFPLNFAIPQTPKTEECTALKHHHGGDATKAFDHFEDKLQQIFSAIEYQTEGIVSIMFAHQSTKAWTTLCNSILNSNMNISSSWASDTEMGSRMIALDKAALATSVTVACKPMSKQPVGDFKEVKAAIVQKVKTEVQHLYELGFRGADLLTACFGQAVSEFGLYERVEKASGEEVSVSDLLDLAREAAFNAIVSDIDTDDYTRFYIGWLNLFGYSDANHDDVRRVSQIGLDIDLAELDSRHLLLKSKNKQKLARMAERHAASKSLGNQEGDIAIDKVHKALFHLQSNRKVLLLYLKKVGPNAEDEFWRVLNALVEVLPANTEDHQLASQLIVNKESLLRDARTVKALKDEQYNIFE